MSAFVHMDLGTGDPRAAKKFYKALFQWKFQDMKMPEGGVYHGFVAEGGPGGGIGPKSMPEQPTAWVPYVGVASVKKAIAKAQKLGATIVLPHQPIGDMGAIGIFIDPTGAALGVWESNPQRASAPEPAAKPAAKKAAAKPAAKKAAAKKPAAKKPAAKKAK